jgi:hypothetical protein
MTLPIRAFMGIIGKKGPPEYVSKGGKSRLRFDPADKNILLLEQEGSLLASHDEFNRRLTYFFPCTKFVPLEIYRCLVKIGFAALPAAELPYFEVTRKWLLTKQPIARWDCCALAECVFSFSTVPTAKPMLRIWKRRRGAPPSPYLMAGFSLTHFSFMFPMPPAPMDRWKSGDNVFIPWFDLSEDPSKADCIWTNYKVRSTEPEEKGGFAVNLSYEEGDTFTDGEFEAVSAWKLDQRRA